MDWILADLELLTAAVPQPAGHWQPVWAATSGALAWQRKPDGQTALAAKPTVFERAALWMGRMGLQESVCIGHSYRASGGRDSSLTVVCITQVLAFRQPPGSRERKPWQRRAEPVFGAILPPPAWCLKRVPRTASRRPKGNQPQPVLSNF
jgi:hypothetical protein